MLDRVLATLNKSRDALKGATIIVAVSGGADSLVMLTLLHELQGEYGYDLHVATFDHQLRGDEGRADTEFVSDFAAELDIPVSIGTESVKQLAASDKVGLEVAARQARYTFLTQVAVEQDASFIATGHNRDDLVETVLMNLIRGVGLAGLRGILADAPLSENHLRPDADDDLLDAVWGINLLRPMLRLSRTEIRELAQQRSLTPREDATNDDPTFLRNRIRLEVLPMLDDLNRNFRESIARMADVVQGDYAIVQDVVHSTALRIVEWEETEPKDGEVGEIAHVDRHEFLKLSRGLQRQLLRYVVYELTPDLRDLPYQQIETAIDLILHGETGQALTLPADMILTVGYDEFTVHYGGQFPYPDHLPHLRPGQIVHMDIEGQGYITDKIRFYTYWVIDGRSPDLYHDNPLEATLAISSDAEIGLRTRRPGDRFCPMGMGGKSQKLSDTFTNLKVPKHLRDRVPLFTVNDEIAWFIAPTVTGPQGRIAENFSVRPDSESILRVRWEVLGFQIGG